MSRIDALRARLVRATELGVPSADFLRNELEQSRILKSHRNERLAQAGRETEDALLELRQEVEPREGAFPRLATQSYDDDDDD